MVEVDVIILSFAKDDTLKKVTGECVQSLFDSGGDHVSFNCIVFESNKQLYPYQYPNTITKYPKGRFGFNRFVNMGLRATSSPYVVIANNDLFFHKGWAWAILTAMEKDPTIVSASPVCTYHHPPLGIPLNSGNYDGYQIRRELAGWCIFIKRSIINEIGYFDEKLNFWYCDYDYANNLKVHKLKHTLVTSSIVDHLDGRTTKELSESKNFSYTAGPYLYYDYKWNHKSKITYWRKWLYHKLVVLKIKMVNELRHNKVPV